MRSLVVQILACSGRLEVLSAGSLPNSMTIEQVLPGQRSPRNPLIVGALRA
jgi:ATP-dependent DNA helicase RecG